MKPVALQWRELIWPRPMTAGDATVRLARLATDPLWPLVVFETRASKAGLRYSLGANQAAMTKVLRLMDTANTPVTVSRQPVTTVRRLVVKPRLGLLNITQLETVLPGLLDALTAADRQDEELVVQLVLGPRLAPAPPPDSSHTVTPHIWSLAGHLLGGSAAPTADDKQLMLKTATAGFQALIRLGVEAATPARRQTLVLGILGALRGLATPTARLQLDLEPARRLGAEASLTVPRWWWPLRLTPSEAVALAGLPVGSEQTDLPGLPPVHPRLLPPVKPSGTGLTVGVATAPGSSQSRAPACLRLSMDALIHHVAITGPTGTGKSVLLEHLVLDQVRAGHGAVVIEPKGDLVQDLLAAIPAERCDDVVLLDPAAQPVVGLNPLAGATSPELKADLVLHAIADLFKADIGPRSTDILHSALLTLAHTPGTSLTDLPRLLAEADFRSRLVGRVAGDPILAGFWAGWDAMTPGQQTTVAAPLMNKLRYLLLRPSIRAVLGQAEPKFDLADVFTSHKILLVPLPAATLGAEGSALLGSLVVAALWNTAQTRTLLPAKQRQPVMICLDEFQNYARLPDMADALATSRSLGVGWVLAHQFLDQLPADTKAAVAANVRSRVVFQLARADAVALAATTSGRDDKYELAPADFMALPPFNIYASLYSDGQVQPFASGRTLPPVAPLRSPRVLATQSAERYGQTTDGGDTGTPANATDATSPAETLSRPPISEPPVPAGLRRRQPKQPAASGSSDRPSGRVAPDLNVPATQTETGSQSRHATSPLRGDETAPPGSRPVITNNKAAGGRP